MPTAYSTYFGSAKPIDETDITLPELSEKCDFLGLELWVCWWLGFLGFGGVFEVVGCCCALLVW